MENTMKTGEWNWQQEENHSKGENSNRGLQGRCAITVTIYNSDDATQSQF